MSNYKNFIQDFPNRCGKILEEYKTQAIKSGLEVTHMLAIASVSISIPFERLRKPKYKMKHPSKERELHPYANSKFANLCDQEFLKTNLCEDQNNSWFCGIVNEDNINDQPESWMVNVNKLPSEFKTKLVLTHLRNSISHANIYTSADEKGNIVNIIFLNRIIKGDKFTGNYRYLKISTTDFNKFLIKWIKYLSEELKLHKIN